MSPHPAPPAPFASDPARSRGRLHDEPEDPARSVFQRDRDRIIHCAAFRRLEYKTQVFVYHEGDYYRTRLTHSLEVAQITRSLCRELGLDEDLGEALALAHDLGHPPFGHAGEDALAREMAPFGGFSHNAQSLRILTLLERRYAGFDGLNMTWETLEGVLKHNGPLDSERLDDTIRTYIAEHDLEIATYAGPEAQLAAIADDIAYNNHDIDDGLRAGLFEIEPLLEVPLAGPVLRAVMECHPKLERGRLIHETVRRMIGHMIADLLAETRRRIARYKPQSVRAVREMGAPLVAFSDEMVKNDRALKDFLSRNMYHHYKVNRMASKARRVVSDLFQLYMAEPECLPPDWRQRMENRDQAGAARQIADFIAGMTDRTALVEHERLFDLTTISL